VQPPNYTSEVMEIFQRAPYEESPGISVAAGTVGREEGGMYQL